MPGKHAPASPKSFFLSLARSGGGVAAVVALIVLVAVFAVRSGGEPESKRTPAATGAPTGSPTSAGTAGPTLSPEESPSPGTGATVSVLNGTTRAGLARRTADRVRKAGYTVVRVGNTTPRDTSTIFYALGARDAALALQKDFPEFGALEEATPAQAREATLTLIIGGDFP